MLQLASTTNNFLQVIHLDGKGNVLALPLDLKRRGSADRGIEGDVASLAVGRSGLDVTPSLTFSACEAAFAGLGASQLIKGSLQSLRTKIGSNRYRAFRHSIVVIRGLLALILGW
jgi:hypothetical protein